MTLLLLFYEFFKTGLFAVGGGMATIPFLYNMSDRLDWFTHEDILDMIAISESSPGPIGINMATFCGFKVAGVAGSVIATLGIITPSIIVILIIAEFLNKFKESPWVKTVFASIRPCAIALIAAAGINVIEKSLLNTSLYKATGMFTDLFNWKSIVLAVIVFIFTNIKPTKNLHPILFIVFSAVAGSLFSF